jgi:hypothetical protein
MEVRLCNWELIPAFNVPTPLVAIRSIFHHNDPHSIAIAIAIAISLAMSLAMFNRDN